MNGEVKWPNYSILRVHKYNIVLSLPLPRRCNIGAAEPHSDYHDVGAHVPPAVVSRAGVPDCIPVYNIVYVVYIHNIPMGYGSQSRTSHGAFLCVQVMIIFVCTKFEGKKNDRTERKERKIRKTYNDASREEASSTHAHGRIQCTCLQVCVIAAVHTAATGNAVKIAVQA